MYPAGPPRFDFRPTLDRYLDTTTTPPRLKHFGLYYVRVLPPAHLRFPVLGTSMEMHQQVCFRTNTQKVAEVQAGAGAGALSQIDYRIIDTTSKKFVFPLCRQCALDNVASPTAKEGGAAVFCPHRASHPHLCELEDYWVDAELNLALKKGYEIKEIYVVVLFHPSNKLFRSFIAQNYKVKMLASGLKEFEEWKDVENRPDATLEDFCRAYEAHMDDPTHATLKPEEFSAESRPAERAEAKKILNSEWGKHSQQPRHQDLNFVDSAANLWQFLQQCATDGNTYEILASPHLGTCVVQRTKAPHRMFGDYSFSNPYIGIWTTAYGRLRCYEMIEWAEQNHLVPLDWDTDSLKFAAPRHKYLEMKQAINGKKLAPKQGVFLGQWNNDLKGKNKVMVGEYLSLGPKTRCIQVVNYENYFLEPDPSKRKPPETILVFKGIPWRNNNEDLMQRVRQGHALDAGPDVLLAAAYVPRPLRETLVDHFKLLVLALAPNLQHHFFRYYLAQFHGDNSVLEARSYEELRDEVGHELYPHWVDMAYTQFRRDRRNFSVKECITIKSAQGCYDKREIEPAVLAPGSPCPPRDTELERKGFPGLPKVHRISTVPFGFYTDVFARYAYLPPPPAPDIPLDIDNIPIDLTTEQQQQQEDLNIGHLSQLSSTNPAFQDVILF